MKKRIALVVNTLSRGGAERTVSNLSIGLSERYDVDIVVNDDARVDYPYEGRLISLGLPAGADRMGFLYQARAAAKRTRALRRMKRSGRYAAVLSFSEMANAANVLSGNRGTRTIVSVRNSIGKGKQRGITPWFICAFVLPLICRKADLTVSCSREIADELTAHYGLSARKSAVIYNGLDLPRLRAQAAEPFSDEEEALCRGGRLIVSVGRLTRQKGHWHLLKAVRALRDGGLPVRLLLLGDGELRPALEDTVARLGLSGCVAMPGFVENPYKYMARADVVAMPSQYEGFSNALIEALACGAPVVSTDHETGAREILAPDTDYRSKTLDGIDLCACGLLVPVCEGGIDEAPEALYREEALLAEAIRRVLTDDGLAERCRQASLRRAEQMDIASICRQWIDAIEAR